MLITYYGHSQFLLETEKGFRIFTDPCAGSVGYPPPPAADVVTVSHGHFDHSDLSVFPNHPLALHTAGESFPLEGVSVTGIPSFHDGQEGALRGPNLIFLIQADGLRVAHLGDLGHPLTGAQLAALGRVDIAMIPVGGDYTISGDEAWACLKAMKARVTLPMHYRTRVTHTWSISGPEAFLRHCAKAPPVMPLIRITQGDLCCHPEIVMLDWEKSS